MGKRVQDFKETDWEFKRDSGFPGYRYIGESLDEEPWIYEAVFFKRRHAKQQFENDYKLLLEFIRETQGYEADAPDYEIENITDFLDKKYNGNI